MVYMVSIDNIKQNVTIIIGDETSWKKKTLSRD
jgi:hypothetical protein